MSQGTSENMHEGVTKKRKRVHTLRDSAIDAGLEAIRKLSEAPAPAVKPTARAAITQWLPAIIAEQSRGTSLLRIYNDLRKATGLRISYRSFQNYVSKASLDAGLRPAKPKAEAGPAARPRPDAEPAATVVEASPGNGETASAAERAAAVAAQIGGATWGCSRCKSESERRTRQDGKAWWACPGCGAMWADQDGEITPKRLNARKE